jgi:hypothetical protein
MRNVVCRQCGFVAVIEGAGPTRRILTDPRDMLSICPARYQAAWDRSASVFNCSSLMHEIEQAEAEH